MQVSAKLKFARFSAQKARLVVNQVRGLPVDRAINVLTFSPKRAAKAVKKLLESAIANAENNNGADVDDLVISEVYANEAPTLKRMHARAKGRGAPILKRSCHIVITVSDELGEK